VDIIIKKIFFVYFLLILFIILIIRVVINKKYVNVEVLQMSNTEIFFGIFTIIGVLIGVYQLGKK